MDTLVAILISLLLTLAGRLSVVSACIRISECEEGKILSGEDDGVTCNTYHQCFNDPRTRNTWIIKSFECPPGGIWDREYLVCVEGTSCRGGEGSTTTSSTPTDSPYLPTTSAPLTTSPTPTDSPPLLTTSAPLPPSSTPTVGPPPPSPTPTAGPPLLTTSTSTLPPDPGTCPKPTERECWNDPISGTSSPWLGNRTRTAASFPGFHGFEGSTPVERLPGGSIVLQNPVWSKTVPSDWQGWTHCPKGWYARGIQYGVSGAGTIVYFSVLCQTPGGNEHNSLIQLKKADYKIPQSLGKNSGICTGTIVGFQIRKKSENHAVTEAEVHCSTPVPREHIALTGRKSGVDPTPTDWTESRYCGKFQAMCGLRITFLNKGKHEAKGMHNIQIKCCHVPDPLKDCVPAEERHFLRNCDNSKSDQGLRCLFENRIGLALHQNGEKEEKELIFYSSIGYDFPSIQEKMRKKIISKLAPLSSTLEYSWDKVDCRVEGPEVVKLTNVCVKPRETVELHQIVGRCGNFLVRTNRFVKVVRGAPEETFDL